MRHAAIMVMNLVMTSAMLSACSGGGGGEAAGFATFNTGLATGFVDYAPERTGLVGPAVAGLGADVVCLQEVWEQDALDAVLSATTGAGAYGYEYHVVTTDEGTGGSPPCTEEETAELKKCVIDNCGDKPPFNLGSCGTDNCGETFGTLSEECGNCIFANIGLTAQAKDTGEAVEMIVSACIESKGASYAYGGRNGLLLLSKHPLSGQEVLRLDSYLNVRVVLHARADLAGSGTVDVYCTHLTANLEDIPYAGTSDSWADEQARQIDAMIDWIGKTRQKDGPVVLLGDMNCGPDHGGGVTAELGDNFKKFLDAGFETPYLDDPATQCTWCGQENPLAGGGPSHIIDHVLFLGPWDQASFQARRVLDAPVTLHADSGDVQSTLSDHFGAMVRADPAR